MIRPAAAVISEMQAYADSVGMTLTTRCRRCKAPLWNPISLHHHLGPVCRAKKKAAEPESLAKDLSGTAATSTTSH